MASQDLSQRILIKELDQVRLKDGRVGTVLIYHKGEKEFAFEPDTATKAEDIEDILLDEIDKVISRA